MKKLILNSLVTATVFGLAACGKQTQEKQSKQEVQEKPNSQQIQENQIIENGNPQYVTQNSTKEELDQALTDFYFCKCPEVWKKFPSLKFYFEGEKGKKSNYTGNESKEELLSKFGHVFEFIRNEYKKPIGELRKKYILENTSVSISSCDWGDLATRHRVKTTCLWHATLLAHRGLASAQYIAGARILAENPKYLKQDKMNVYIKWLVLAAKGGEYDAFWVLGMVCNTFEDYKNCINFWNRGIEKQNINCIMAAADKYFFTFRDYKTALSLYKFASKLGHYHATMACGEIYSGLRQGHNTKDLKNHKLAIEYYNKAIEMIKKNECRRCVPKTTEETIKKHIEFMKKYL